MKLCSIQLTDFRNFESASLSFCPRISLITGVNGSGKSSIIEAIYYLGYGRSFRSGKHNTLVRHGQNSFTVFASGQSCSDHFSLGVSRARDNDNVTVSINGQRFNRLSAVASLVPVQLFTPQSTDSILCSPLERRRSCDWGLFHVEHGFSAISNKYARLLKHRNALLRDGKRLSAPELSYWTHELAVSGESLSELRNEYVSKIESVFLDVCSDFIPEFDVEIAYHRGWERGIPLVDALVRKTESDNRLGYTTVGPHKADIRIRANGLPIQDRLSRGQQRMIVAAFQLSQTIIHKRQNKGDTLFLLDDIGAELDATKREKFVNRLLDINSQVIVTAIDRQQLSFLNELPTKKMFHVEHNHVIEQ